MSSVAQERPGTLPLVWFGPLRELSGYADEGRAYLLALEQTGHPPVAREPFRMHFDAELSGRQREAVERALARRLPEGEFVAVHHRVPRPDQTTRPGVPNVVRTMFESDRLPVSFKSQLIEADEVWVPTAFNLETFTRGGLPSDRVRVLPETIDFDLFTPGSVEEWPVDGRRSFTFLSNFDFTDRKGWDVLLDAWAQAFDPDDDVCLLLKCVSLQDRAPEEIRGRIDVHLDGRTTAPILLNTELLPIAALPRLYAAADAYVMPSRGEGWGRPYMEAMAMGLPTIGSRWSGNLAFMDDRNAWLVGGKLVDVPEGAQSHTRLYRGHRWFDPDIDALAATMREVFAGGAAVLARAGSARADLIDRFGPEPTAARIVELTSDLLERWRTRSRRAATGAWRGDFGSGHSLAVVNDGVVQGLERAGETIDCFAPESLPSGKGVVGVASQWPPSFIAPTAGPFVLYQPWEFGRVPQSWVESIRTHVDEVWAPSEYVRQSYIASGVAEELVHVVPNGVDLQRFSEDGPAWPLPTAKGTVFLFVGGTIARKGIDVLLRAYGDAFTSADDVCLVLKGFGGSSFYRGQTAESLIDAFKLDEHAPELVFLDEEVPFDRLPSLYRAADVLVQPYRGEGFCLPALEALACGVPVIVTAGGPTDDFTSEACAWHVPSRRVPLPTDAFGEPELALAPGGFLLEPEIVGLVAALRSAADPAERTRRARHARGHAEPFGWDNAATHALGRLEALRGRVPVRKARPAAVPERRGFLFHVPAEWHTPETWVPALHAYAEAFSADDDVTLVFLAREIDGVAALVGAELDRAGRSAADLADIALADPGTLAAISLELAADAVICPAGTRPPRARLVVPPTASALRAAAPLAQEAA